MSARAERILVLGATSALAEATLRALVSAGPSLLLVGRNRHRLDAVADDLRVRGVKEVACLVADLAEPKRHGEILDVAKRTLGEIDVALVAYGTLANQAACEASFEETERELATNFLSVVSLGTLIANEFEGRRAGCLVVISSVAGDRARRSNYVYGMAKGATSLFLQGLRARLAPSGVSVITVKPGPVDTPMTAHLPKDVTFADARSVGRGIARAIERRGPDIVYLPGYWRWIMLVIRALPERFIKKLPL